MQYASLECGSGAAARVSCRARLSNQFARMSREGWVNVEETVNEQGFVSHVEVLGSKGGKQFETETVKAVSKWRYAPKFVDGKPVSAKTWSKISFTL
ncbi:hypothetical protein AYI96_12825 [Shewanella sp. MSW]|nr:hypothetical protein BFS86_18075 [Shewanella algae]TVP10550.1 hypothetical protein AYI96_12825 [Shewanella sp. MSW]